MTTLGQTVSALSNQIISGNPLATVYLDSVPDHNDKTPYPLYEIQIVRKSQQNFQVPAFYTTIFQIILHTSGTFDKFTLDGFNEKDSADKQLRQIVQDWYKNIRETIRIPGIATLSNIETMNYETLNQGQTGSFSNNIIRIGLRFSLNYLEN